MIPLLVERTMRTEELGILVVGYVDIVIFPSFTETCLVGGNSFLTNSSFGDISQHQQDSILLFLQGSAFCTIRPFPPHLDANQFKALMIFVIRNTIGVFESLQGKILEEMKC